jgi:hypothetical protein
LEFHVRNITAPADSSQSVAKRAVFKFSGRLKAYQSSNVSGGGGPAVLDVKLIGKGQATVHLGISYDLGGGSVGRNTQAWLYSF